MKMADEIEYRIIGDDMQLVEIVLDPMETVIAEAGAMNYMDDGIDFEAVMGEDPDRRVPLHDPLHKSGNG